MLDSQKNSPKNFNTGYKRKWVLYLKVKSSRGSGMFPESSFKSMTANALREINVFQSGHTE